MMNTTSYHWQKVLKSKGLTPACREAARRIYEWQLKRDAISRDVIDGTIKSDDEEERELAAIGKMPAFVKIGGVPVRERFYVGKICFAFDHHVANGFRFFVSEESIE